MKLNKIITAVCLVTLATSAIASENKRHKYSDLRKEIFSTSHKQSFEFKDYSNQLFENPRASLLTGKNDSFEDRREFKFFTDNKFYSRNDEPENYLKHFSHGKNEGKNPHSFIETYHFKNSHEDFDGYMNHESWCHLPMSGPSAAPVPEPESYALVLAGLLMMGVIKLRKI